MPRAFLLFAVLLTPDSAYAEIEKIAHFVRQGYLLLLWPKLPVVKGWHQDRDRSFQYGFNAQAPEGKTFADAETVIYADAPFKLQNLEAKTLQMLIEADQQQFRSYYPGIDIREIRSLVTGDGKQLRSFMYSSTKTNSWEQMSYGEEGEFYLIFAVRSQTRQGLVEAHSDYKQFIKAYKSKPLTRMSTR